MNYPNFNNEIELLEQGYAAITGIDEVGRGAWAGPIVAAAVILSPKNNIQGLNDSKMLSAKQRERLYDIIMEKAVGCSVGIVSNKTIDEINIGEANLEAVNKAIAHLKATVKKSDYLLIDFLINKKIIILDNVPYRLVKHGDKKIVSIAAASIIAKVARDRMMVDYNKEFPEYGFERHKGYGTFLHRQMIAKYGICDLHRKSFKPIKKLKAI
ncbi:MAG: ribonuclease HII [Patescibacteria group bacterium]|nr:ribonuclease HII [Patescibacteria group bacterium]